MDPAKVSDDVSHKDDDRQATLHQQNPLLPKTIDEDPEAVVEAYIKAVLAHDANVASSLARYPSTPSHLKRWAETMKGVTVQSTHLDSCDPHKNAVVITTPCKQNVNLQPSDRKICRTSHCIWIGMD